MQEVAFPGSLRFLYSSAPVLALSLPSAILPLAHSLPVCLPAHPRPTCSAGRMVLAVVHMAPDTMPSASPERTIIVPAWQGMAGHGCAGRAKRSTLRPKETETEQVQVSPAATTPVYC